MSRIVIALFSFLLLVPQGLWAAGTLTTVVMTNQTPDNACTQPPAATSFSPTDKAAWIWFLVTNVSVGDDYSVAFLTPAGSSFGSPSDFGQEQVPGTYCYAVSLNIAGYSPATMPGTWNANIYNKGSQIYRQPFTIGVSTTTCSYSLSSSSAQAAATGGTGSIGVTTGTGCTWAASTDVAWITGQVSGNTVNYTVAANTSTSSRVGHITVGPQTSSVGAQTFTITQAGASGGGTTSGNLIQNGDAEAGPGGTFAAQPTIPSWNTDGQIAVPTYAGGAGALSPTTPGPANRGNNYFAGGPNNASSKMTQTVDLSSYASAIDAGTQAYTLDGWLGGYGSQDDNAVVTVTFQSASGGSLGTATIGPVLDADRGGVSALVERNTSGNIPTGTRKMLVTVTFTRAAGSDNDGALDNLSFVLGGGGSTGTSSTVYYRFENGTAGATATGTGSIVDSAGSQNGTPSGAVTYSSDVPLSTVGGAANTRSLSFASNGSVQFPGAFPLNGLTNATMEFYIKPTGTTVSEMDILWTRTDSSADANRFNMGIYTSGSSRTIFLDYRDTSGNLQSIFPGGGALQIPY